jgi:hypothetical protein
MEGQLQFQSRPPIASLALQWRPYQPPLTAESRAEVVLLERQMFVQQSLRIRSTDPLPHALIIHGPDSVIGLSSQPILQRSGPGQWRWSLPNDNQDALLKLEYVLPRSAQANPQIVGLFHLPNITSGHHIVRLWSAATTPEIVTVTASTWRELPLEALLNRTVWPLRVLQAPCSEAELPLHIQPRNDTPLTVWIERALIQVWIGEDHTLRYRARWRIRRWLSPSLQLQLPVITPLNTEIFLDGRRIEPTASDSTDAGNPLYQLTLPEYRPNTPLLLDVRYIIADENSWWTTFRPPSIQYSGWDGPLIWQVSMPSRSWLPWLSGPVLPLWYWQWSSQGWKLQSPSEAELEEWFHSGSATETVPLWGNGSAASPILRVATRQVVAAPFRLWKLPAWPITVACSLCLFGWMLLVFYLPTTRRVPVVLITFVLLGPCLSLAPFATLQLLTAGQLGLYGAWIIILFVAFIRYLYQRRIHRLPGFRREPPPLPLTPENKPGVISVGSRRGISPANGTAGSRPIVTTTTPSGSS